MPSASALLIALGIWVVTGLGAWFYRAHIDAGNVQAALNARTVSEQDANAKAEAKGRADGQKLAEDATARANKALEDLDDEKAEHAKDNKASHANLVKALAGCRVARADVRVLDVPSPVPNPASTGTDGAAGQLRDESGTVGAVTIVETCKRNRDHFDANLSKLQQCVTDYNAARAKVNVK